MEGITTATGGTSGIKVDKSFYVTMSVPLYTGGMNSAMKRQSMEAVEASLLRLDDTRITVKESIQNAFAGYKVAEANIKVLLIQYQMSKEALDNAQKQVEAGKMPIDSLTPLKNNLLNMQTSLKNASADLELAKMSLFLALGWLEITQDGEPTQNSIKITTDSK
jgi:outer membrane protein TolC